MRDWGYSDARTTKTGSDEGIDVVARGAVAQVKHYGKRVGRPDVQKLVGASRGAQMFFFAQSGFSRHAVDYALEHNVALFEYDLDGNARPLNRRARDAMKYGPGPRYDFVDRRLVRAFPSLEKYVSQQGWWSAVVIGCGGTLILPIEYGSELGIARTVLGVVGCCLLALVGLVMLGRGAANSASEGVEEPEPPLAAEGPHPVQVESSEELVVQRAEGVERVPGPGHLVVAVVLFAAPCAAWPFNGGGWWWALYGPGWLMSWLVALGLVTDWVAARPSMRWVGPTFTCLLGACLVPLPLLGLRLEVNGWWWALFGTGWVTCWLMSFGLISSGIEELREQRPSV